METGFRPPNVSDFLAKFTEIKQALAILWGASFHFQLFALVVFRRNLLDPVHLGPRPVGQQRSQTNTQKKISAATRITHRPVSTVRPTVSQLMGLGRDLEQCSNKACSAPQFRPRAGRSLQRFVGDVVGKDLFCGQVESLIAFPLLRRAIYRA